MIKVVFGGGLGNQMFQYAYLFSNFESDKREKVRAIMHRNEQEDFRNFSLDHFAHSIPFECISEEDAGVGYKIYKIKRKAVSFLIRKLKLNNQEGRNIFLNNGIVFSPTIYGYDPMLKPNMNCYIEGGFQNWRYFNHRREELLKEFQIKDELSNQVKIMLKKILSCNSVCVHVRRGDYVNNYYASTLAICDDEYYRRALELIVEKVESPEYFVFTNTHEDHLWIKDNYHFSEKVNYVDLNNPDYVELFLMSNCKHFIIANSTFSWWAQYLSSNPEKVVVAPSKWYRGNKEAQNIYMPNWSLINVR